MKKQKQIKKLEKEIQRSVFVDEETKRKLLSVLSRAKDEDLQLLSTLFGDADKKQAKVIDKIVEYDDTFVARLKHFKKSEVSKYAKGKEKAQRKKEKVEDILKEIE